MGTSRRYVAHYDRVNEEREIERLAKLGKLQTLSPRELQLDSLPVTISPKPHRVRAWVRFGAEPYRVVALAERWTRYAVGIHFTARDVEYKCWVWGSAVDPITDDAG